MDRSKINEYSFLSSIDKTRFVLAFIIAISFLGFSVHLLFKHTDTITIMIPLAIAMYFMSIGFRIKSKGMRLRHGLLTNNQVNHQGVEMIQMMENMSTTLNSIAHSFIKTILVVTVIGVVGMIAIFLILFNLK